MSEGPIYLRIIEGDPLPDIGGFAPFRAVVVIDATYSREWQNEVSDWLVNGGCLYMMAWGEDCSSWDDSVDWAQIRKYPGPDGAPEADFVMTTWHDKETLESVFWYCQFCASDPYDLIKHTLIVHVGGTSRDPEFRALFEQAESLADREDLD